MNLEALINPNDDFSQPDANDTAIAELFSPGGDSPVTAPEQAQYQEPAGQQPASQEPMSDYERQLQDLQAENERLRNYEQFGRLIEQDENLYNHMQSYFIKGNEPQAQASQPEPEPLVRPSIPDDPYDQDAFRTYHEQLLAYNEKLTERKAQEIASAQVQQFQQQLQAAQAQQLQQQAYAASMQEISQRYGANQDELAKFQRWASDPSNVKMEHVYRLYQLANGTAPAAAPQMQRAPMPMQQQAAYPAPLTQLPAAGSPQGPQSFTDLFARYLGADNGQGIL